MRTPRIPLLTNSELFYKNPRTTHQPFENGPWFRTAPGSAVRGLSPAAPQVEPQPAAGHLRVVRVVTVRADAETSPHRGCLEMVCCRLASPRASRQASTGPSGCRRQRPRTAQGWRTLAFWQSPRVSWFKVRESQTWVGADVGQVGVRPDTPYPGIYFGRVLGRQDKYVCWRGDKQVSLGYHLVHTGTGQPQEQAGIPFCPIGCAS